MNAYFALVEAAEKGFVTLPSENVSSDVHLPVTLVSKSGDTFPLTNNRTTTEGWRKFGFKHRADYVTSDWTAPLRNRRLT